MHALHRLGQLLSDLPGLAPGAWPQDFCTAAVARLAAALDSDSGVWASGALTAGGPDFHTVALWQQPPSLLADYEALKPQDPLFQQVAAHPGRAFSADAARSLPPVFQPFVQRYGLAQALSALVVHPHSGLLNGLSLWRSAADRPFTADDEALLEAALPHLIAQAENRLLHSATRQPRPPLARGCADTRGRLHAASAPFLASLNQAWPGWHGPDLPAEIQQAWHNAGRSRTTLLGPLALRFTAAPPYVLVDARPRQAWDRLRPREVTIAGLAADGLSHKAIAATLGLAPATVRNHLASLYTTLGVHNRAQLQAARAACRFGDDDA